MADTTQHSMARSLITKACLQVVEEEREVCATFLERLLTDMGSARTVAPLSWHEPETLVALFRLFQQPPGDQSGGWEEALQVRVELLHTSCDSKADLLCQEGTQIIIHLQDTPFILGVLRNTLKHSGLTLYAQIHSTFAVLRQTDGRMLRILNETELAPQISGNLSHDIEGVRREMLVVILTEATATKEALTTLHNDLIAVLASVKRSVDDFPLMMQHLHQEADRLRGDGHEEESRFLHWTTEGNFVFMGMRFLKSMGQQGAPPSVEVNTQIPALGIFREPHADTLLDHIMPGMRREINGILAQIVAADHGQTLSVEYCQHGQAIIHTSDGIDFFVLSRKTKQAGTQPGEHALLLVLGRFSRSALSNRASTIPILSQRMERALKLSGYTKGSYLFHEFCSLYDRMPLRELFYSTPETLTQQICAILQMQGDIDLRISARLGHHSNYLSVLVVLSRSRYRPQLEKAITDLLSRNLLSPITSTNVSTTDTLFFIVCYANHDPEHTLQLDLEKIRSELQQLVMTWEDKLREKLLETLPQRLAFERYRHYAEAFGRVFKEVTSPEQAVEDIAIIVDLETNPQKDTACHRFGPFFSRIVRHPSGGTRIKLYSQVLVALTEMVQTFHHFGITCLHELSFSVDRPGTTPIHLQCFEIGGSPQEMAQLMERADALRDALSAIRCQQLRDDTLNRLVLLEGLRPKEVSLLRALRQYLVQIHLEISAPQVDRVLIRHHTLARLLLARFLCRFDPHLQSNPCKAQESRQAQVLKEQVERALVEVSNLQEDQIIRRLFNIVDACVRTNYFQSDTPLPLSLKIECARIHKMPSPRPWREIFVYSPQMEGIHLRGGPVARGGLRFSDRLDDYRTEVLGLMKTQTVKNAIIVPVGAKGGFVLPTLGEIPPEQHKAWVAEQYQNFIRALLDLTDNRVEGEIVQPANMVIYEEADPYLVVAADKGTATFSDLANKIAQETYHFWLGDAFASGGSHGYDHKKVGITARGAWECIRLHFEELDHDIHQKPFTVVGIGDMAGDVFGNGLLASQQIALVGAFNHQHIFLDPSPDPFISFAERQRLFLLPRSAWADYDPNLLSEGGGVFERSAKSIPLNDALRQLLETQAEQLSGEEVIRLMLCARVDLLYNGGIGTYIKARDESHVEVSDKNNDTVRVNAIDIKARVIGEGGNLGITQRGRLEVCVSSSEEDVRPGTERTDHVTTACPPKSRGYINTDALDNAGGVNLSDHEVNLKILFNHLLQIGEIPSLQDRHEQLAQLSKEVAASVLESNRLQHQAISRDRALSCAHPELYRHALDILRSEAGLDFKEEDVPAQDILETWMRSGVGLPRPLLAILLGYAKLYLNTQLLASDVVDLPFFEYHLTDYFPVSVARNYSTHLGSHFLKREIIATCITNRILDQTGTGPLLATYGKLRDNTRREAVSLPVLVKSYLILEHLLDAPRYRKQVQTLGHKATMSVKYHVLAEMEDVLLHLATWMVTHLDADRISIDLINLYGRIIQAFRSNLWDSLPKILSSARCQQLEAQRQPLLEMGLAPELATETVLLPFFKDTMAILHIKETLHSRFEPVAHLYIQVDDFFGLSWIETVLQRTVTEGRWEQLNLENLRKELRDTRTRLVKAVILFKRLKESVAEAFEHYRQEMAPIEADYLAMLQKLRTETSPSLLAVSVLVRKLGEMLLHSRRDDL